MYNMLDFVKEKYSLKSVQLFESYTYLPKKCMYSSFKSTFFPPATSYKDSTFQSSASCIGSFYMSG